MGLTGIVKASFCHFVDNNKSDADHKLSNVLSHTSTLSCGLSSYCVSMVHSGLRLTWIELLNSRWKSYRRNGQSFLLHFSK